MSALEPTNPVADAPPPPPPPPSGAPRRAALVLVLIAVLGVSLRIGVAYLHVPVCEGRRTVDCLALVGDTAYVTAQAQLLANGSGTFVDPRSPGGDGPGARLMPLYPVVLAQAEALGFEAAPWSRVASSLIGGLTVMTIGAIGWQLGGRRRFGVAVTAAGVAAVDPAFWLADVLLRADVVFLLTMALTTLAALWLWRRPGRDAAIALGVASGLMIWSRADGLLLVAALLIGFVARAPAVPPRRRQLRLALVSVLVVALMVAPWVLFNAVRFDRVVVLTTSEGTTLASAYCDSAYRGEATGGRDPSCAIPGDPTAPEAETNVDLRTRAWDHATDHLDELPLLLVHRALRLTGLKGVDGPAADGSPPAPDPLTNAALWVTWLLVPFAAVGVRALRRSGSPVWPLLAPGVSAFVTAWLLGATTSARLGLDLSVALLGSVGLAWVVARVAARMAARRPPAPHLSRRAVTALVLAAVFALSLGVRLTFVTVVFPVCELRSQVDCYRLGVDSPYFRASADAVADGKGFTTPLMGQAAQHPPLHTLLLAGLDKAGLRSIESHRFVLAVIGALGAPLLAFAGIRILASSRGSLSVGAVAGVLFALNPNLWVNDGMYLSESLLVTMVPLVVLATYRLWRHVSAANALWLGCTVAVAALIRPEVAIVLPVVLAFVLRPRAGSRLQRLSLAGLSIAVVVVAYLPWIAYNLSRFDQPVLVTSTPYTAMRGVACDDTTTTDLVGYHNLACFRDQVLSESVNNERAQQFVTDYVRDHPDRMAVQVVASQGRIFGVFRPLQGVALDAQSENRGFAPTTAGLVWFYVLAAFAAFGGLVMRRSRVPISPLLAWALSAMFAAAVSGGILRYRAPFDATLTLLAAIGIWYAIGDWSRAGKARLPAVAALPNEEASDDTSAHDAGADEHESAAADS